MFSKTQYEAAATRFFQEHPDQFQKYLSPKLLETVVNAMQLPSVVSARIAFHKLVEDGTLTRTDGGNAETDAAAAAEQARATIRRIEEKTGREPLTREEYEFFISLSPRELSRLYYGEDGTALNRFAMSYRAAVEQWGFKLPARFDTTPPAPDWAEGLV